MQFTVMKNQLFLTTKFISAFKMSSAQGFRLFLVELSSAFVLKKNSALNWFKNTYNNVCIVTVSIILSQVGLPCVTKSNTYMPKNKFHN